MGRPSVVTRAIRLFTALLTVWCLGCSAFDEVLACVIPGAAPTMTCASEGSVTGAAAQAGTERQRSAIMAAVDEHAGNGADCDCGSCHAPAPSQLAIASPNPPLSDQPAHHPGIAPTTTRAPLVPPPQRVA